MVAACALGALLAAGTARCAAPPDPPPADDPGAPPPSMFTVGGFGTLGVVHANTTQADFISNNASASGAGYTRRWSPVVDSRLGAHLGAQFNKQWSGVLQVTSQQGFDGSYRPQIEWLNVKYQATPDLSMRVGRITLPMYLAADHRKVGYAYAPVRPPLEVYNAIPITATDGIEATYRWRTGTVKHRTQATYGTKNMRFQGGYRARATAVRALTYTVEAGDLSMFASALSGRLALKTDAERVSALLLLAPDSASAQGSAGSAKRGGGYTVGASYDTGRCFLMSEAGIMNSSFLTRIRSAYVTAGYRHGKWTPYLTLAAIKTGLPAGIESIELSSRALAAKGAATPPDEGLKALLRSIPFQSSASAGLRWDLSADMALKVQLDRVSPKKGSGGTLINQQPLFRSDVPVYVTSMALDFVF